MLTSPSQPHTPSSERVTVKRLAARGVYDPEEIHGILDAGFICHVAFAVEGQPRVLPTAYVRVGDEVYLHGSPSNQMLRSLVASPEACVCVTHVDGLVLARSAFHHSINYRSVVLFGPAREVDDTERKLAALHALTNRIIPGRWNEVRTPNEAELKGTLVIAIRIAEASAKVRNAPPKDDEEDYALPVWAGVVPLSVVAAQPVRDPRLPPDIPQPAHVTAYLKNHEP